MTAAKHTQGEWLTDGESVYVQDVKGARYGICVVSDEFGEEEALANANMLAAAPKMREALEHALRVLDNVHLDIISADGMPAIGLLTAIRNGRAAITQATGAQI